MAVHQSLPHFANPHQKTLTNQNLIGSQWSLNIIVFIASVDGRDAVIAGCDLMGGVGRGMKLKAEFWQETSEIALYGLGGGDPWQKMALHYSELY